MTVTLADLSALDRDAFTARLGHVVEHSPWVAEAAWDARPFASVGALHGALVAALAAAGDAAGRAVLCAHPELAAHGALSAASTAEQLGIGLDRLDGSDADEFAAANRAYRAKFGFPFIVAVRGQRDAGAILAAMRRRLSQTAEAELATAMREVAQIARFRLDDLIDDRRLTVHVLDTATGRPAEGVRLTLGRAGETLGRYVTNAEGRCDAPLLAGERMTPGVYEIVFDVEAWRGEAGFYDRIVVRFRVVEGDGHLHVPLLLAPFGYSTYRGS